MQIAVVTRHRVGRKWYICSGAGNSARHDLIIHIYIMITYQLQKNNNQYNSSYGKYYARAVHQKVTFAEFITHMAQHHCAFSEATIRGVLIEMETCLRELLLEGKAVYMDELGIFSLGIENAPKGCANAYDFNVARNIKALHLNIFLGRRFRAKQLLDDAVFGETKLYTVDSSKPKETETPNTGD